jgi:hypothetical protein
MELFLRLLWVATSSSDNRSSKMNRRSSAGRLPYLAKNDRVRDYYAPAALHIVAFVI